MHIPDEVMDVLKWHDWPGNIRELQNVIERAVIMTTGRVLDQRATKLIAQDVRFARIRTLVDAERAHIIAMLQEANWVVGGPRGAAAQLGLARTTLIAMMARLGISRETLPQTAGGRQARTPDQLFAALPSARSNQANGIGWQDPDHDNLDSRLKNGTLADFQPMQAASCRT